MISRGCLTILFGLGIILVLLASIASSFSDWRQSANAVTIAQIDADAAVTIAQINADTTVEVAQINADATRDTSMAYLAHRMLTAVFLAAGLVWVAVVALFIGRWLSVARAGGKAL